MALMEIAGEASEVLVVFDEQYAQHAPWGIEPCNAPCASTTASASSPCSTAFQAAAS